MKCVTHSWSRCFPNPGIHCHGYSRLQWGGNGVWKAFLVHVGHFPAVHLRDGVAEKGQPAAL